jgi:hypothetical protein
MEINRVLQNIFNKCLFLLLLFAAGGCSNIKYSLNYSHDKVLMEKILIVTFNTPETHGLDTAIAARAKERLAKKKIDVMVVTVSKNDSATIERETAAAIARYKPECVVNFLPAQAASFPDDFLSLNYNLLLYRKDDSGRTDYLSGTLLIWYRNDRYGDIVREAGNRLFHAVWGMQRFGCGC